MVSVVVCTYRESYLSALARNIEETIGVEYEFIPIVNAGGKRGICNVYNEGIRKAKYPILCFAHEDIAFHSQDWGKKAIEVFKADEGIGLLGVAGGSYKPRFPSGWSYPNEVTTYVNIIQNKKNEEPVRVLNNPVKDKFAEVASVDGLWFCTRKNVAEEFLFDEHVFKGFHCYDVDFSLSVSGKHKVVVTFDILIEHFSEGKFDINWVKDTFKLHKKWAGLLPVNVAGLTGELQSREEEGAFLHMVDIMRSHRFFYFRMFLEVWKCVGLLKFKAFVNANIVLVKLAVKSFLKYKF